MSADSFYLRRFKCPDFLDSNLSIQMITAVTLGIYWIQEDFLDKYESLEALLMKCYPNEALSPSSLEMKEIFKALVF